MSSIVSRSTVQLELDDSDFQADLPAAEGVWNDFIRRMRESSGITPTVDLNEFNKRVINFEVDPATSEAGLAVINKQVAEFTAAMRREAHFTVGVNVTPVRTAMTRLRGFMAREAQSISDGIHFWLSRGLLKAARDLVKLPIEIMKEAFGKFQEQEESTTRLAKALASTGEAAGKSKEELEAYAKQLEKTTLVSDQVTMGVQSILLASEGLNGINFDRATRGALDLASAIGGDASTHAARLGKSLQDPVRGMEQLRDAGISFTEEQQDTIKFLVETNNLVDAQGILLDELESRFGGAANNTGSMNERINEQALAYENLQEKIGELVAEQVETLIPAMAAGIDSMETLAPAVVGATVVLAELSVELAKTILGIDGVAGSTEDLIEKTDEWIASIKAGAAYLDDAFDFEGITAAMDKMLIYFGASGTDPNDPFYNMDLSERYAKRYNDELAARKKAREDRKKQAEEDAKQAKEAWRKEQEARGLGQGKLSDAAKAAVQQAQDAKDAIRRNKDEQAQKRKEEAEYARQDAEDARDHAKAVRDAEKSAREAVAAEKKAAREAAKALAKEESDEKKRLMEEDKKIAKEKADYEKSMGRDSLLALNERIQDARYLRRDEEKDKKSVEERAKENVAKRRADKEKAEAEAKAKKGQFGLGLNPANSLSTEDAQRRADLAPFMPNGMGARNSLGTSPYERDQKQRRDQLAPFLPLGSKLEVKQDEVVKAIKDQTTAIVRAVGPDVMGN